MSDLEERLQRLIRPEVRALRAYHVPESAGYIKLDAMENPYGWPEPLVEEWLQSLRHVQLNRYPDPQAHALQERLRSSQGIAPEWGMVLGNGSDELIQMLMMAVAAPGRVVLSPEPSFVMYRMIALLTGMRHVAAELRPDDFALDLPPTQALVEQHRPALTFLAYPNNPTGNLFDAAALEALVAASPGLVVIDEAYLPFAQASCERLLDRHRHVLILRTLSKLGLAGLRLGLLIGHPEWIEQIDKVRLPYNINVLTQVSADLALCHQDVLDEQTARIRADREALYIRLRALPGIEVWPSRANFLLFRLPGGRGPKVFAKLRASGVLVKNLHGSHGALQDCLRVTVGTPAENQSFLDALRAAL